jgi:hypothetical protein
MKFLQFTSAARGFFVSQRDRNHREGEACLAPTLPCCSILRGKFRVALLNPSGRTAFPYLSRFAKAWLDQAGHPATEALHVTERFRRRDFGHLEIQVTMDDAKVYGKAWSATLPMNLLPDTGLLEFVCNENERDVRHLGVK